MTVLLAYAAFILIMAAPFVAAALLAGLLLGGVVLLFRGILVGNLLWCLGGIAAIGVAIVAGFWGFRLLVGKPPPLPEMVVATPRAQWSGPLPEVWVSGHWNRYGLAESLLLTGKMKRLLLTRREEPDPPGLVISPEQRRERWSEVQIVPGPACAAILSGPRTSRQTLDCIRIVPIVMPGGTFPGPHFSNVEQRDSYPGKISAMRYYLVDGESRQLVLSVIATAPRTAPHPLLMPLFAANNSDVWRRYGALQREALDHALVAAIDRR